MYLLDTNVISETIKNRPNPKVINWLSSIPNHHFYISVLSIGEIRKGIETLQNSSHQKKEKLTKWLEVDLVEWFYDRVIVIDEKVVDKWGAITAIYNLPAVDSLIAASTIVHGLKLVTRNSKDFNIQGLDVINPWK